MMIPDMVISDIKEWLRLDKKYPQALKDAVIDHERFKLFVLNMTEQIYMASQVGKTLSPIKIKTLVYSMTEQFVHMMKVKAEENYMSQIAQNAIRAKDQKEKDLDATVEGKPSGEIGAMMEETGIEMQDSTVKSAGEINGNGEKRH